MATQRQINRMDKHDRRDALKSAAMDLDLALNLFGVDEEPIAALLAAETEPEMIDRLDDIMTPECHCEKGDSECSHAFPRWFMRQSKPQARAFERLWRQIHLLASEQK
ncbi:MAG: hypothetical protein A2Y75_01500 [Candidatus Solincola sediminis]|uniref:Uncharacterized protein n=1 Tax=Candidatus Solincola sediminis TaxID=1797199 RepID=A0A1F2WNH9_9ACTN|nr:MAG: hypothetical protein A2Y75_01500 [Candidatus Solincola sediminis]